jgi:endonuclease YncB( thermonuclease family)
MIRIATLATALALASAAHADPCKAIPDRGPMPAFLHRGAAFAGHVVYVGDGDGLCVDVGSSPGFPENWVEVRVADFYASELHEPEGPAAKAMLERLAMGRMARCVAEHRSHDRIVARCSIGGRDIGDLMRRAGVREGGNGR